MCPNSLSITQVSGDAHDKSAKIKRPKLQILVCARLPDDHNDDKDKKVKPDRRQRILDDMEKRDISTGKRDF